MNSKIYILGIFAILLMTGVASASILDDINSWISSILGNPNPPIGGVIGVQQGNETTTTTLEPTTTTVPPTTTTLETTTTTIPPTTTTLAPTTTTLPPTTTTTISTTTTTIPSYCNYNSVCDGNETVYTCPQDCPGYCGDAFCNVYSENMTTCPGDCGAVTTTTTTTVPATTTTLATTTTTIPSYCNYNSVCDGNETAYICPQDCPGYCGDVFCNVYFENMTTCPGDCGAVTTTTTVPPTTTTTVPLTTTTTTSSTTTTIAGVPCSTDNDCGMADVCINNTCKWLNCYNQTPINPSACNRIGMNHTCIDYFCPTGSACVSDPYYGGKYCQSTNQTTTTTLYPTTTITLPPTTTTTLYPTTTTMPPGTCSTNCYSCYNSADCLASPLACVWDYQSNYCYWGGVITTTIPYTTTTTTTTIPIGKCGDGICDDYEKSSNSCPIDCPYAKSCTSDTECSDYEKCINNTCKYLDCWKEKATPPACYKETQNHQCVDKSCGTNEQCITETHWDGTTSSWCKIKITCSTDNDCFYHEYCNITSKTCKSLFCNIPTDPNACYSMMENHKCLNYYCPTGQECVKDNMSSGWCRPIGGGGEYGKCGDKIDNDNDGMTDCMDPDCGTDTACMKYCGNMKCESGEDPMNCPADCGSGTKLCSTDLDCASLICPTVVGGDKPKCSPKGQCYCGGVCGDQYCDYYEQNSATCPTDCYKGGEYGMCNDGIDNENDGMTDCKDPDCGPDPACVKEFCGNKFCGFNEDPMTCPIDCGGSICGCDTASGCQAGCSCDPGCFEGNISLSPCGDNICQPWEDVNNCQKDCSLTNCSSIPSIDNNVLTNYKTTSKCFDFSAGVETTNYIEVCDLKFTGTCSKDVFGCTDPYMLTAGSGKIMGIGPYVNLNNVWQIPSKDSQSYTQSFPLYQVEDGLALITKEGNYVAFVVTAASPDSITFSYKYSTSNLMGCPSTTGCSQYSDENSCKNVMMTGMNCYWDFTMRSCNEQMVTPVVTPVKNPGCGIFNGPGAEACNKVNGCSWNPSNGQCVGTIPEVKCENIINETMCNKIPMLSTCCKWANGACQTTTDITCREKPMEPPEGAKFCEDYNALKNKTLCDQIASDPWYMPCVWDAVGQKCGFNQQGMFVGGTGTFGDINSKSNCEAAGGIWKSSVYTYTDAYGTIKTGTDEWCEMNFGYDVATCDTSCWACEKKSDGSQWSSEEEARQACKNSKLGICEFHPDSKAMNGIGFCDPVKEFSYGVADCDFNCYDCAKMQNKQEACDNSKAGCKWIVDSTADLGGYCKPMNEKSCENDCFRCDTPESCSQKGPSCTWTDSKVCIPKGFTGEMCFDGIDNNGNGMVDCKDPQCTFDPFCGGGMISDCPKYGDKPNCEASGCIWMIEGDKEWCADPGEKCVQFDGDETGCTSHSDCQWFAESECDVDEDAVGVCLVIHDSASCNAKTNCKWFTDISGTGGWCDTKFFSCKDRQEGKDVCESDNSCRWVENHCEPRCFTATQSQCNNGCKWVSGICDPKNLMKGCPDYDNKPECDSHKECAWDSKFLKCQDVMSFSTFKTIESPPVIVGNDPCGGSSPDSGIPAEYDICTLGIKDNPDSYGIGTGVGRMVDSAACRGVPVMSDKDTLVVGTGIKPSKFYWYLDTDGNNANGCKSGDNKENGFEFFLKYETRWVTNITESVEEGKWTLNGVTVSTGDVTISGKGWLEAKGNGSIQFRGKGRIELNNLDSTGGATLVVTDYSSPMDSDIWTEGFSSKISAGVITYSGKGTAVIKGSDIGISLSGDSIYFYGEGIGQVTLKGTGAYKKGKVSGNVDTTMVAYRCADGNWAPIGIKLTSMRDKMCSMLKGGVIVVNKEDIKKLGVFNSSANMRIYATTATESNNELNPADTIGPAYYTPGTIDFTFTDCFAPGNNDPNCQKFKKYGFVQMENCVNGVDDDSDGFIDCADQKCKFAPECNKDFTKIKADINDKTAPKVTFHKVDTFPDGAFVMFHTDEPSNGTIEFYYTDEKCKNLNTTMVELGDPKLKFDDYKPFHGAHIDNFKGNPYKLGYNLAENMTYYYKTTNCDPSGNCAYSACSNFTTNSKSGMKDFVVKFNLPPMMKIDMDFGGKGTYDIKDDAMNYGKKVNYSEAKMTNVKFKDMNLSSAIELTGMSFTSSKDMNLTDAFVITKKGNKTLVGIDTTKWQEIKDLIPDSIKITIPDSGDALYKCKENGENCTDVSAGVDKVENESNETQSTWVVPVSIGFSVYKVEEVTVCTVKGDKTPCDGKVSDFELLDYISEWAKGNVDDFDLLSAIDKWAKG